MAGVNVAVPGLGSLGVGLGGLPPLDLGGGPSSAGNGAVFMGPGQGPWNVNLGGSGVNLMTPATSFLMLAGVALLALWLLKK